jgi:hypothetical protein
MSGESDNKHAVEKIKRIFAEWLLNLKRFTTYKTRVGLIIPLALLFVLASVSLAQQTFQQQVASSGTIKTIGVTLFWDHTCTNKVTSVSWGAITSGGSVDKYVYVRNDGTTTATLSMSYGSWVPATAASYMAFRWNCSNYALSLNAITCAKMTLTVQPNITGVVNFSFMILVQATG